MTILFQADIPPERASDGAAGFDLCASEEMMIQPGQRRAIRTGVRAAIPPDHAGFVKPRSGFALNFGIDVLGGLIDSDYRGEIIVILVNHGDRNFHIDPGDRIAQLVVTPVVTQSLQVESLDDTQRGGDGFGSTGRSFAGRR